MSVCLRGENGWEICAGDHEHPSALCSRCHLSGVPSAVMLGDVAGLPARCLGTIVFCVAEVLLSQ